jgi:Ca2+/H+ antiporter
MPIIWMWAFMWIVGLSFSISALRQARTELRREQARAYLIAFGFRDVAFFLSAVMFTVVPPTTRYFHVGFLLAFPIT